MEFVLLGAVLVVKSDSSRKEGPLDKFIKSPPACCQDAAAPADYSIKEEEESAIIQT